MLHVRAWIVAAPGRGRDVFVLEFMSIFREANDIESIARILHLDQAMERQGDLLRRLEAAIQPHGSALIQHQDRRTLVEVLRTEDLEILWHHPYWGTLTIAPHRIHDAVLQVQIKRIAILIELRIVRRLNPYAMPVDAMSTVPPNLQTVENIVQRFLADFPNPLRCEFKAVAFPLQITGLFQTALQ